jgi:hypothetical protein
MKSESLIIFVVIFAQENTIILTTFGKRLLHLRYLR